MGTKLKEGEVGAVGQNWKRLKLGHWKVVKKLNKNWRVWQAMKKINTKNCDAMLALKKE